MLESAVWLFQQHDWTVAEHGMAALGHVPRTAAVRLVGDGKIKGRTQRRRELGTG